MSMPVLHYQVLRNITRELISTSTHGFPIFVIRFAYLSPDHRQAVADTLAAETSVSLVGNEFCVQFNTAECKHVVLSIGLDQKNMKDQAFALFFRNIVLPYTYYLRADCFLIEHLHPLLDILEVNQRLNTLCCSFVFFNLPQNAAEYVDRINQCLAAMQWLEVLELSDTAYKMGIGAGLYLSSVRIFNCNHKLSFMSYFECQRFFMNELHLDLFESLMHWFGDYPSNQLVYSEYMHCLQRLKIARTAFRPVQPDVLSFFRILQYINRAFPKLKETEIDATWLFPLSSVRCFKSSFCHYRDVLAKIASVVNEVHISYKVSVNIFIKIPDPLSEEDQDILNKRIPDRHLHENEITWICSKVIRADRAISVTFQATKQMLTNTNLQNNITNF